MVPGTEVIKPVVPPSPLPAGFFKESGPKQGGPIFEELLKKCCKASIQAMSPTNNVKSVKCKIEKCKEIV